MNGYNEGQPVSAKQVSDRARMTFLPAYFGHHYLRGESMIFDWAGRLSPDYSGGHWQFYELSNGGFYLAPIGEKVHVEWHLNGFEGVVSADAFGIIVTLYTLCHIAELTGDAVLVDRYHHLREFSRGHAESAAIWGAID